MQENSKLLDEASPINPFIPCAISEQRETLWEISGYGIKEVS